MGSWWEMEVNTQAVLVVWLAHCRQYDKWFDKWFVKWFDKWFDKWHWIPCWTHSLQPLGVLVQVWLVTFLHLLIVFGLFWLMALDVFDCEVGCVCTGFDWWCLTGLDCAGVDWRIGWLVVCDCIWLVVLMLVLPGDVSSVLTDGVCAGFDCFVVMQVVWLVVKVCLWCWPSVSGFFVLGSRSNGGRASVEDWRPEQSVYARGGREGSRVDGRECDSTESGCCSNRWWSQVSLTTWPALDF